MAGESLHEERGKLGPEILDRHRAISTLMEELEAIDWYDQRIMASGNAELRALLSHNRDEEAEHASMLLESMDLLRKMLFREVKTVRIHTRYTQPEMAADMLEIDLEKLAVLWQGGRDSARDAESDLRNFLT